MNRIIELWPYSALLGLLWIAVRTLKRGFEVRGKPLANGYRIEWKWE